MWLVKNHLLSSKDCEPNLGGILNLRQIIMHQSKRYQVQQCITVWEQNWQIKQCTHCIFVVASVGPIWIQTSHKNYPAPDCDRWSDFTYIPFLKSLINSNIPPWLRGLHVKRGKSSIHLSTSMIFLLFYSLSLGMLKFQYFENGFLAKRFYWCHKGRGLESTLFSYKLYIANLF